MSAIGNLYRMGLFIRPIFLLEKSILARQKR